MLRMRWTRVLSRRKTPATTRPTRYAGSTASLFAVVASPPRKKRTKKMNFTSGSLTRLAPSRTMMNLVQVGINQSIIDMTTTKTSSQMLKFANNPPSARLARKLAFNDTGSISAPARNVNTPLPSNARKLIQSVFAWRCKKFPATTPTRISINATEMPVQIDMRLATRANAIQAAATNQTFSNIKTPTDTRSVFAGVISSESVRAVPRDCGGQTPLPKPYIAISLVKLNRNSLNWDVGRGTSALALFQESRVHLESCRLNVAKSRESFPRCRQSQ